MHHLQSAILQRRAALGPSCHQSHLVAVRLVSYHYCTIHWVIILSGSEFRREVPSGSKVEHSQLHFECIGVSVEDAIISDLVANELEHDFLSLQREGDAVEFESPLHSGILPVETQSHCG